MTVPDVNVLVHAYNTTSLQYESSKEWLQEALSGKQPFGLAWPSIVGFIRVSTSGRVFRNPFTVEEAIEIVNSWVAAPVTQLIWPGVNHAQILFGLLRSAGTAGNLTTDAHIAALAIEYDAEVATTDMDFGRFPGLKWFVPGGPVRRN